ncbi:MAG: hypothetical protein ACR2PL_27425 [Dehalococcoidia bacterium]
MLQWLKRSMLIGVGGFAVALMILLAGASLVSAQVPYPAPPPPPLPPAPLIVPGGAVLGIAAGAAPSVAPAPVAPSAPTAGGLVFGIATAIPRASTPPSGALLPLAVTVPTVAPQIIVPAQGGGAVAGVSRTIAPAVSVPAGDIAPISRVVAPITNRGSGQVLGATVQLPNTGLGGRQPEEANSSLLDSSIWLLTAVTGLAAVLGYAASRLRARR